MRARLCAVAATLSVVSAASSAAEKCTNPLWPTKPDIIFAQECADYAFEGSIKDRHRLAWMYFARVNQAIKTKPGTGISGTDVVPLWMAWPTDADTFNPKRDFDFDSAPRIEMKPSAEKKDILAGVVSRADPDGANEEVTRNKISHTYLRETNLITKKGVDEYFSKHEFVDMPIGSVELKASWLQVTKGSPAPEGAMTFAFETNTYWLRGLHVMVKMRKLEDPGEIFYTEEPSWFWTTFEFNDNLGVQNVRKNLTTQRDPLDAEEITKILSQAGANSFPLQNFAPNGTQIRFTVNGEGEIPVIVGHTNMEDFAGWPNTAQPQYWTSFQASCHSCHATAAYNPDTKKFFPFSVPVGILSPGYNKNPGGNGVPGYLGQGYRPLDFMWPIAFNAK